MTRHSKNNTTSGSFTYAERQKLNYGSQSARCSKETLRPWTHCHLCLKPAQEPNACPRGHLTCRQCVLEDILAQKVQFKTKLAEEENILMEAERKKQKFEEEERKEALKEFLLQQQGGRSTKRSHSAVVLSDEKSVLNLPSPSPPPSKSKSFQAYCKTGQTGPHPISSKILVPVKFSEIEPKVPGCPACLKPFTSIHGARLIKKCGHVTCDSCNSSLKVKKCLVCEETIVGEEDLIVLEDEGTGFAAGGGILETKKYDIAFQ